jgi:hypothetical protein
MIGGTMPSSNVADLDSEKSRPSIHMPHWASRLTLVISDVKLKQLQDINGTDAGAEGVEYETAEWPFWYVPRFDRIA